jgi:hypothetical protein
VDDAEPELLSQAADRKGTRPSMAPAQVSILLMRRPRVREVKEWSKAAQLVSYGPGSWARWCSINACGTNKFLSTLLKGDSRAVAVSLGPSPEHPWEEIADSRFDQVTQQHAALTLPEPEPGQGPGQLLPPEPMKKPMLRGGDTPGSQPFGPLYRGH